MEQANRRGIELDYGRALERPMVSFFNTVYAWMAVGLAVTATVAYLVAQSPAAVNFIYASRGLNLILVLGTIGIAIGVRKAAINVSATLATVLFLVYAAAIGALISGIFIRYQMQELAAAFLLTGGVFGGMSVFGFVTKRDLTSMGSMLIMCLWGILLATIVNVFIASSALSWVLTYVILAVFIGLTAYDTQKLKAIAESQQIQENPDLAARMAIMGSLELYLDFINIFLSIIRIIGSRK
jgi:uncharacterized protein